VLDPTRVYSVLETHRETHMPRAAIYEAVASGDLPAIRRGKRWWISGVAVIEWIAALGGDRNDDGSEVNSPLDVPGG
jgi:hypothetical protein